MPSAADAHTLDRRSRSERLATTTVPLQRRRPMAAGRKVPMTIRARQAFARRRACQPIQQGAGRRKHTQSRHPEPATHFSLSEAFRSVMVLAADRTASKGGGLRSAVLRPRGVVDGATRSAYRQPWSSPFGTPRRSGDRSCSCRPIRCDRRQASSPCAGPSSSQPRSLAPVPGRSRS
jgi:hypothetical protein